MSRQKAAAIEVEERETYENMWQIETYGDHAPGERYIGVFAEIARQAAPASAEHAAVLDAGSGNGKPALALARAGFVVTACDLVDARAPECRVPEVPFVQACLWHDLRDLAYLAKVYHRDRFTPHAPEPPHQFDHVYCTDVMEHIPPALTMLVVARMLEVARTGVFMSIATTPDNFGVWVGKHLHQTVQPFTWWRDMLGEVGWVADARDLGPGALFYVRHR